MSNNSIKNCEFAFKCPEEWSELTPTENLDVRFCDRCDRGVYLAEDDEALAVLAALGKCVAIRVEKHDELMGMLAS